MGKMMLPVDVQETLSLAWYHPFVTGLLVLMCTSLFSPVVMYFLPLLISTALVAVLIISAGQAPTEANEKDVTGWNSKVEEEDNSAPKAEESKHQSRFPGEERFLEWFHSLQSTSFRSSSPVTPPRTPKGQRSAFQADESKSNAGSKEDSTGRQLKGRLDFERSFSFRTGERVAAAAGIGGLVTSPPALPSPTVTGSPNPPHTQMVSIPSTGKQFNDASAREMPSIFRYDERSGAIGTPKKRRTEKRRSEKYDAEKTFGNDGTFTNVPSKAKAKAPPGPPEHLSSRIDKKNEMVPFGSFCMSEIIEAVQRAKPDEPSEPQRSIFEMGRDAPPMALFTAKPLKSHKSKKFSRLRSVLADKGPQEEFGFRGVQDAGLGTDDKSQSFLAPRSPGFFDLYSRNPTQSSEMLPDDTRSQAYNATLRAGNAAGYSPSSRTDTTNATVDCQGLPPTNRKGSANKEKRQSTPSRFWKATSWQAPLTPSRQTPQTPSRQTPQTPSRQTQQTQSWQTPQTPSRQTPQTPSRETLHTLLSQQTSQASTREQTQKPNRQTKPRTNWNWRAPPSAIWKNSQSEVGDANPLSTWQSPARTQPYTAWQDSPLPSWHESPATHTANTLKTSRSRGVRKLDEYSRYHSALNDNI